MVVLHDFELQGERFVVRRAEAPDVGAVVHLLESDAFAAGRDGERDAERARGQDDVQGGATPWDAPAAFARINADPAQLLVVVNDAGGFVVGTLQLTFVPGLSRRGATRLQIEAVRVRADRRGSGIGSELMRWSLGFGRARGAALAQLTSDGRRTEAHAFYARLGFVPSHLGFKRTLA